MAFCYLAWLEEHAGASGCRVHAYVLMTNYVHLLISADEPGSPGRRYQRSGSLWEGRFRSCLIQEESYLLVCQRYIELNPVRAGIVHDPAHYAWSSYRGNAEGQTDPILSPHPLYRGMGADAPERQRAYRGLFRDVLGPGLLNELRKATNGNFALGNQRFTQQVAAALGRRVEPYAPGRPRK